MAGSSIADLEHCIHTCPIIDNHAHNIYQKESLETEDLMTITTEASGRALDDIPTSLPHLRAARQLCQLYDLPPEANWKAITERRAALLAKDASALTKKCLENTQTILLDDGFDDPDILEPYQWHSKFTSSPCKRLIRIEEIASNILSSLHAQEELPNNKSQLANEKACGNAWAIFLTAFEAAIAAAIESPEVAGFKSAICFTSGLSITMGSDAEVSSAGFRSFQGDFLPECIEKDFAIEAKGMNDAIVISTCKLIDGAHRQNNQFAKPMQFHTGIGNKEIPVLESNPAYLQPLITAFPHVPIVLLHASYPYTRIAGHMATVFKNVYLDIGAVFPEVSRDGQERVLRECLEMTPWATMLWSTDGHWFPETFWLANLQGREALRKVLVEYVERGDFAVEEGVRAARGILFGNANRLYGLGLRIDEAPLRIQGPEAQR